MIWTLLYVAIGMVLAWDTCRACAADKQGLAEALGDFTGFVVITLLWLPIVACVVAVILGRRAWRR